MTGIDDARRILLDAMAQQHFPAAAAEVGNSRSVIWQEALGTLSFAPDAPATRGDTWFDLASLTKPVAATTIILDLAARGVHRLGQQPDVRAHRHAAGHQEAHRVGKGDAAPPTPSSASGAFWSRAQ